VQRVASEPSLTGKLPDGFYRLGEIEVATRNLLLNKADVLPKRANNSKLKIDRIALLDGIAQYLVRLLLQPDPVGSPALGAPHGRVYLWHNNELLALCDNEAHSSACDRGRVSISDLLYIDDEPFLPFSQAGGLKDDADFASYSSMIRNDSLCLEPSSWTVRKQPKFSLDSIEEYTRQSGKISRWNFELQSAREAWEKVEPFSGGTLIYSFPTASGKRAFKRPSEIAKLLETRFVRMCIPSPDANTLGTMVLDKFRKLPESDQKRFTYPQIALAMGYQANQTGGTLFRTAVENFKSRLTDQERDILPKGGRPKMRRR